MSKAVESKITSLIAQDIAAMGYDLVRIQVMGGGQYSTLQIMAERQDQAGMTVEDCAAISKKIGEKMEADPTLADRFDLEVSSPGIDRPLVRLTDYERYRGHVAKIELGAPVNGTRRFQGMIASVADDAINFVVDKDTLSVPFATIEKAKLVLTDALLKAAASGKVTH